MAIFQNMPLPKYVLEICQILSCKTEKCFVIYEISGVKISINWLKSHKTFCSKKRSNILQNTKIYSIKSQRLKQSYSPGYPTLDTAIN